MSVLLTMALVVAIGAALRPVPAARTPTRATTFPDPRPADRIATLVDRRRPVRPARSSTAPAGEVAAWCDALGRAVRSGSSLTGAIVATPPPSHAPELTDVCHSIERGASLDAALAGVRPSDGHLALAYTVLRACAVHGGPAAEPLDRAAATLRARDADDAERRTQSAQARSSATVMTVLPMAMLGLLVTTSATVRDVLTQPIGLALVAAGGGLNLVGWRWMRRLTMGSAQ